MLYCTPQFTGEPWVEAGAPLVNLTLCETVCCAMADAKEEEDAPKQAGVTKPTR